MPSTSRVLAGACVLLALAAPPAWSQASPPATVREVRRTFTTYPFDDPDPVPRIGRIYPYFRFDGFTSKAVAREYTVVELENAWLRVTIIPAIGGKIWSVIDKATGRSIVYDNHVVKFRDVAMRGPWTSGGIEANYGIIGHTPNVATPVDYLTRTNADGSVSCIIGALDLLTRTPWRLEITLPADGAYVATASSWYNASPLEQPYYTWMNAAIPVGDDLEFVYPGTRTLGHDGELGDWPVNRANGKRVSWYRENDFGGYKSYHVFGSYTDFVGAYWHDRDFGMVRWGAHDEKPGKKLWIWGLSRQGMIWEGLLTDADGQYTEVQSGRLFNQTADGSTYTPFKHRGFSPHLSERWTEYWFPVHGMGGLVAASPWASLNVRAAPAGVIVSLQAVQALSDTLEVRDGDRVISRRQVTLRPLEITSDTLPAGTGTERLRVALGAGRLRWDADPSATALDRPVTSPAGFDWPSAYGHYLLGKERVREREFIAALPELRRAVALDSNFTPALGELASLSLRLGDAEGALAWARRALAMDTYDPLANYTYGLASRALGRITDARDGLDLASQSVEFRSAAWTELAKLYLQQGDRERARTYAAKALDYDTHGMDARQVRAVVARLDHDAATTRTELAAIDSLDPLGPFTNLERFLADRSAAAARAVTASLRGEMPHETLLELSIWYHGVGRDQDAETVLSLAAAQPEVLLWRAWLHDRLGEADVDAWLARAEALSPRLVFPFRTETAVVLRWALERRPSWQVRYYLALVEAHLGRPERALALLEPDGNGPTFAPYYALRAQLLEGTDPARSLADWRRAMALDPAEWRYGRIVAERLLRDGQVTEAVRLSGDYARRHPDKPALTLLYARALLRADRVADAAKWMDQVTVLPAEGAKDAHEVYREANLLLAVQALGRSDSTRALALVARAREWPERLGAGKSYPADVDERLEDFLEAAARGQSVTPPGEPMDDTTARVVAAWKRLPAR
jgi:tetratricopeptide (TPR) repeat protein